MLLQHDGQRRENFRDKVNEMNAAQHEERSDRTLILRELLAKERADILTRLHDFRPSHEEDGVTGDEGDIARSISEVETHARLVERAGSRLREIDAALNRLAAGDYGICLNCGEEIPLARLQVIPFAIYCVDCQAAVGRAGGVARGAIGSSFGRFSASEGSSASPDQDTEPGLPPDDDLVSVHTESEFGPEEGELEAESQPRRKRGRPRKNPL